jgi:MFS family permease
MSSAAAFNSSTYQIAAIAGPAIGGLVYGFFGDVVAFVFPCVLSAAAFLLSLFFSKSVKEHHNQTHREPFLKSITSGLKFSINHKVLFPAMTLDMFSVLFGGAVAILPMFADQVFHLGPSGLGFLRAAPSLGSVIVSVWLAFMPMKKMYGRQLIYVVVGWAMTTILFALSTNFYIAMIFLALSGMFDGVSMVIRGTILQIFTPDEMRGRVSAVNSVFITSSNEIGAFESGFAASLLGLVPSVVFGGAISLLVVAIIYFKYPEFKNTQVDG